VINPGMLRAARASHAKLLIITRVQPLPSLATPVRVGNFMGLFQPWSGAVSLACVKTQFAGKRETVPGTRVNVD